MTRARRRIVVAAAELLGLVAAHAVLIRLLASTGAVAVVLASGPGAPKWALAAALLFLLVRLLLYLLLPGFVLARLGMAAVDRWMAGTGPAGSGQPTPEEPTPPHDAHAG